MTICTFCWFANDRNDELTRCDQPAVVRCGKMAACQKHAKENIWANCVRDLGRKAVKVNLGHGGSNGSQGIQRRAIFEFEIRTPDGAR